MRRPDFFLVGAPRCGTSTMNTYLKQHPKIFMADKESHFFASDLEAPWFIRNEEEYLSLFAAARDETCIGEASVMYLYSKTAASRIQHFCPEAKILAILRNPIDMMYSLHSHNIYGGSEDIVDFEAALNAEEDRRSGLRMPRSLALVDTLFYRQIAKYTEQVERYLELFGRRNVLVVIYEEFQSKVEEVYQDILAFLGVQRDFRLCFEVINANRRLHSLVLQRVLRRWERSRWHCWMPRLLSSSTVSEQSFLSI